MIKTTPQKLAEDIMHRSKCNVMVGACIADRHGIFAWGWNYDAGGFGIHAEEHAIFRANTSRLEGASIYVCGERRRNERIVEAFPCEQCWDLILGSGIGRVYWRNKDGIWMMRSLPKA